MSSIQRIHRLGISAALFLPLLCGAGCPGWLPSGASVQNVTPAQAAALIQEHAGDANFVIVDVRNPDEFAGGHIQGAMNVCYLCSTFAETIASLDKAKTYLVYCGTDHRSPLAVAAMSGNGFTSLYNLSGGLAEWRAQGLPVVE